MEDTMCKYLTPNEFMTSETSYDIPEWLPNQ